MIPSSDALWASAGPATRSPIAHTCATEVRISPLTSISPRVVELDAGLLEPEALDVGPAAGGDDQPLGLGRLVAVGERARRLLV